VGMIQLAPYLLLAVVRMVDPLAGPELGVIFLHLLDLGAAALERLVARA
jgi:hypothetical protein